LGRDAIFSAAEQEGVLDEVEDELFRFGRIVDREPALAAALAHRTHDPPARQALLDSLIEAKVHAQTKLLLDQTVTHPRGRSFDRTIDALSDEAAVRRNRSVANVRTSVPLTPDQEDRLAAALRRIYGRAVVLQVEVDRELLGGMVIAIGDDVIDGSVVSRLDEAARGLTR